MRQSIEQDNIKTWLKPKNNPMRIYSDQETYILVKRVNVTNAEKNLKLQLYLDRLFLLIWEMINMPRRREGTILRRSSSSSQQFLQPILGWVSHVQIGWAYPHAVMHSGVAFWRLKDNIEHKRKKLIH